MRESRRILLVAATVCLCGPGAGPARAETRIYVPEPGATVTFVNYGLGINETDYLLGGALAVEVDGSFVRALPFGLTVRAEGPPGAEADPWPGSVGDDLFGTLAGDGGLSLDGATAQGLATSFLLAPAGGSTTEVRFSGLIEGIYGDDTAFWSWTDVPLRLAATTEAAVVPGGRFLVAATWSDGRGGSGVAHGRAITRDGVVLWFFSPDNPELTVKVLDACVPFGRFWVFAAGLTNVGVELQVTDRWTDTTRTYGSAPGTPFAPVQATDAFATCSLPAPS